MPKVEFDVASICLQQETRLARAFYGITMRLGTGIAQLRRPLCRKCDKDQQTSLRAALKAIYTCSKIVHEVSKLGYRDKKNKGIADNRPMKSVNLVVVIRTRDDYVIKFENRELENTHGDVHVALRKVTDCLRNVDVRWITKRIDAAGDYYLGCAEKLAEQASSEGHGMYCETCEISFDGRLYDLVEHFKEKHLKRNLKEETQRARMCSFAATLQRCSTCGAGFSDREALMRHVEDIHMAEPPGEQKLAVEKLVEPTGPTPEAQISLDAVGKDMVGGKLS